ncbi:hypothetical protein, partial [Citrobacter freundii]|uniref:hypothetical protein n=1 Tax=Citrobacter freundii TaxID=546 RepID=UPI0024E1129A
MAHLPGAVAFCPWRSLLDRVAQLLDVVAAVVVAQRIKNGSGRARGLECRRLLPPQPHGASRDRRHPLAAGEWRRQC